MCEEIDARLTEDVEKVYRAYFGRMTVRYGLHSTRALIAWYDETIAQLDALRENRIVT